MTEAHNRLSAESAGLIRKGDALDLLTLDDRCPDLVATDPPYAFGGSGDEHAISATVAIVLRTAAQRLKKGRWMLVMCASSWRSTSYMVESVRGCGLEPVRIATWCKPAARTKVETTGWKWASVNVIALRKGKAIDDCTALDLDHITEPPVIKGRRAELPARVAEWVVRPFSVPGGLMIDPFAGSGALVKAAAGCGMDAVGYEKNPACTWCGSPVRCKAAECGFSTPPTPDPSAYEYALGEG